MNHQQYNLPWLFFLLLLLPIVAESLSISTLNSFHLQHHYRLRLHNNPDSLLRMTKDDDDDGGRTQQLLESLRSLRVKEIKSELESRGISTRDAFEKEELVQRLYMAKISASDDNDSTMKKKKKKKRRQYDGDNDTINDDNKDDFTAMPQSTHDNIIIPFQYFSLEASKSVASANSQDIYIRPSEGKYAAIKVTFQQTQSSSSSSSSVSLNLLVDTACSGLVISPNSVQRVNNECPGIFQMQSVGATMTTAGGSQGAGVAKWDRSTKMIVGGVVVSPASGTMSNLAAVQDIGALPSGLDGIIGLSFLNQFTTVDFDFTNGRLCLYKKDGDPALPSSSNNNGQQLSIAAQGRLALTRLGIYTTQTSLGGRGPVSMLVDTGAASTFLNWNGVSQLNLSRESPLINPIAASIGAMGADNMALQLTHRFVLKRWNLSTENAYSPAGLPCLDGVNIDIGELPVLEQLKGDGVGGILGADLLMMCDVVRFSGMNAGSPTITLWKSEER